MSPGCDPASFSRVLQSGAATPSVSRVGLGPAGIMSAGRIRPRGKEEDSIQEEEDKAAFFAEAPLQ